MKKKPVNYTQFGVAAILILALIVSVAWFSPVMAQTKKTTKEKRGNKTVTTTTSTNKKGNTKSVTKTIIIDDNKDTNGVHPDDIGNAEDIKKRVQEAMVEVDMSGMGADIKAALEGVDWEGIGNEVHTAIAKVDWDKMQNEASIAMANIDWDEIEREIQKATKEVNNVNWDEINKQIKEATADMEVYSSGKAPRAIVMKRGNVTASASKMSIDGNDISRMLEDMEDDGSINMNKGYKIELEDGALYIDGKQQTGTKADKYMKYFEKDSHTVIKGDKNNTSINVNINR